MAVPFSLVITYWEKDKPLCSLVWGFFIFPYGVPGFVLGFVRPTGVYLLDFFCSGIKFYLLLSPYLCFISFLYLDLYVLGDDALIC